MGRGVDPPLGAGLTSTSSGGGDAIVSRRRPKQNQIRLTSEEVGALVAAYQAGSTLDEVAADFGIYVRTAAAHLERHGVAQRRHRLTSDEVAEAIHLYEQGWSLSQIGERFGVWPQSIGYRLRRAGVKLRARPGRSPTT